MQFLRRKKLILQYAIPKSQRLLDQTTKIGRIIPILKPNKSPDQSKSYCAISLLSPLAKLMEKYMIKNKKYDIEAVHLIVPPRYSLVNQELPERNLRKYAREHKEDIESAIPIAGSNQANLKSIHTADVRSAINNYSTNPITANRPLQIDGSDYELPRKTRATLAQLRPRGVTSPTSTYPELIMKIKTSALLVVYPLMMYIICSLPHYHYYLPLLFSCWVVFQSVPFVCGHVWHAKLLLYCAFS